MGPCSRLPADEPDKPRASIFEQRRKVVAIKDTDGFKLIDSALHHTGKNVAGQVYVETSKRPHLKAD